MGDIAIKTVRYTHDAIIDVILGNPAVSQNQLCAEFGYSPAWMSIIVNSDAFKERLAERKGELVDPKITASYEDRLVGAATRAIDKIIDKLDNNLPFTNGDLISVAKLGLAEKSSRVVNPYSQTNNYIVQLPPVSQNAEAWLTEAKGGTSEVVDISPRGLAE